MAWQDRDYNRDGSGGGGGDFHAAMTKAMDWSFPIGTYLGTSVRVHYMFVILVVFRMLGSMDPWWTLRWIGLLFITVLLHEFGHVLGCRSVGGSANRILMWPLGGLAYCSPPRQIWAEFVTVACGPLVNVIIAATSYLGLMLMMGPDDMPVSLNPTQMWGYAPGFAGVLADLFGVNYFLFLFNMLLVFYPFDGGKLVQIALWKKLGYRRSMLVAARVGMVGAVGVMIYGVTLQAVMMILIGVWGFITSYQAAAYLREEMIAEPYDFEADTPGQAQSGWLARWKASRTQRKRTAARAKEQALDAEVDRILAKVKDHGLQSLTDREKKTLATATERQRKAG